MSNRILLASAFVLAAVMATRLPQAFHSVGQTDFYLPWHASQVVFHRHGDPYSQDITLESQRAFFGHVLEPGDRRDQRRFAYPIYVCFLLAPMVRMPLEVAERWAMVLLVLITGISTIAWIAALAWKVSRAWLVAIMLLIVVSPPVLQGLALQQLGLFVAALIAVAALCAVRDKWLWSGILLAGASIKPQMMVLPLAWFSLQAFRKRSSGKRFAAGFLGTMVVLIVGGEMLSPGWVSRFISALVAYRQYGAATGAELFLGRTLGLLLSSLVVAWLILKARRIGDQWLLQLALVMAAEILIIPGMFALYNCVLLLPGGLLIARYLQMHSRKSTVRTAKESSG